MAFTDAFKNISSNSVNLPLLGSVGIPVLILGGLAAYLLLFRRKGRITSVTTRYRK